MTCFDVLKKVTNGVQLSLDGQDFMDIVTVSDSDSHSHPPKQPVLLCLPCVPIQTRYCLVSQVSVRESRLQCNATLLEQLLEWSCWSWSWSWSCWSWTWTWSGPGALERTWRRGVDPKKSPGARP